MYGIGYSLFNGITFLGSRSGVAFDPDAEAFMTAAAITDATQQSAVNQLVLDLKAGSIWSKMKGLYPFVGGSATPHRYNLVTAASDMTWFGGLTHDSSGVTGNGSTGYGDTGFNPTVGFSTDNSVHLCIYSRTNTGSGIDVAASTTWAFTTAFSGNLVSYAYNSSTGIVGANTDVSGIYVQTRTTYNVHKIFRNNVQFGSTDATAPLTRPNANLELFRYSSIYSSRNIAFMSIGDGLSDAEATTLYNAITTFNTTLGR